VQDLVELIHVVSALEDRLSTEKFRQDAANRPYVDGSGVVGETKHDFRRTVPSGGDIFRHETLVSGSLRGTATRGVSSRESKVTNLELTVGIDQEVSWLEIAMKDVG